MFFKRWREGCSQGVFNSEARTVVVRSTGIGKEGVGGMGYKGVSFFFALYAFFESASVVCELYQIFFNTMFIV